MNSNISFYMQYNNKLFSGTVLTICYKANKHEIQEYGLTNENILIFVKNDKFNKISEKKDIDYFSEMKDIFRGQDIFLRIQSECLLGMYGDSHCDCEEQRIFSIKTISERGGIFFHLPQEAQGWGLHYKLQELELQVSGRSQEGKYLGIKNRDDAQKILVGNNMFNDFRSYKIVYKILSILGIENEKYILISDSERKITALKNSGLNVIKYSNFKEMDVNSNNLSEFLVKILNNTHNYDEKTIDKIEQLIVSRKYNNRTLSTLTSIVDKINCDKNYTLDPNIKEKMLDIYDKIICGIEKRYIVDDAIIKIQNNFSCKVNSSIFKGILNVYGKNIFDRISLEKLYYFENKVNNKSVRIRSSKVLNTIGKACIFMKGQIHVEQKTFNEEKTQVYQDEISLSKLRSFFENNEYDYVKKVEMITIISERQIPGINIYIKRLPNIESRVMDIFGNKEDIKKFISNLVKSLNRNVFNEGVSNSDYEDENFTDYNLRFADLDTAIQEELAIYELMSNIGEI